MQQMISSMEQLKNTPIDLVDLVQVQSSITSVFMGNLIDTTLQDIDIGNVSAQLDDLTLAFAALTFEALTESNAEVSLAFLDLSMKTAENYVGPPTLSLTLALFLQHVSPCIKPTDYDPVIFEPLRLTTPVLGNLVELVALNGKVLDKMHNSPLTYENVIGLESVIGKACFTLGQPLPNNPCNEEGFEARCVNLAHVHMFWLRIMLRTPFLLSSEHWLPSLSIYIHAAQMLLSVYFNILGPAIQVIAPAYSPAIDREWKCSFKVNQLPPTWRQVRRIMTSVLIVFYAYWYGEVSYDEAGRACARSIISLAAVSGINTREYLKRILSDANEAFIANVLDVDNIRAQEDSTQEQQADDSEQMGSPQPI
ncbi:hypothetical protein N7467_008160 [Penicillium canescens]|nr:hypothetical protein N7467_008160 [Penicillium canescens]